MSANYQNINQNQSVNKLQHHQKFKPSQALNKQNIPSPITNTDMFQKRKPSQRSILAKKNRSISNG